MRDITSQNFGLLVAYVIPGFTVLWGFSPHSTTIQSWMSTVNAPTVGGFLYVTIMSVGLGLFISTVRWMTIDRLHYRTGVPRPEWNFSDLSMHTDAVEMLIQNHYRYYQWHANMAVAVPIAFLSRPSIDALLPIIGVWIILFVGSRDTLAKYHQRVQALLSA